MGALVWDVEGSMYYIKRGIRAPDEDPLEPDLYDTTLDNVMGIKAYIVQMVLVWPQKLSLLE